jgi:polar amino acid transport system substrate-binding protein
MHQGKLRTAQLAALGRPLALKLVLAVVTAVTVFSMCAQTVPQADPSVTASLRPMALPAPGNMPPGTFMQEIQDRGRLVCGVSVDKLMVGYLDPRSNQFQGFDVEMCQQVAKAIFGDASKVQFVAVTSAMRIPALKEGRVDLVVSTMTINADRKKDINFSEVYYEAGQKVLVRSDATATGIGDLSDQKVCAAKGSTSVQNITTANPRAQVVEAESYGECLVLFQQSAVNAISTDDVILVGLAAQDPYAKVVGERFTAEPYGMGIAKEHTDFVRFVNAVMQKIKYDGTWKSFYKKWFDKLGPDPEPPAGTYVE